MKKEVFCSCFCIIMSSPTYSDISQNNAEILEKQWQEEWRLLVQMEEVAKLHQAEHVAQKARRKVEEKTREKAERQRIVEKEERKRRTVEYL